MHQQLTNNNRQLDIACPICPWQDPRGAVQWLKDKKAQNKMRHNNVINDSMHSNNRFKVYQYDQGHMHMIKHDMILENVVFQRGTQQGRFSKIEIVILVHLTGEGSLTVAQGKSRQGVLFSR